MFIPDNGQIFAAMISLRAGSSLPLLDSAGDQGPTCGTVSELNASLGSRGAEGSRGKVKT